MSAKLIALLMSAGLLMHAGAAPKPAANALFQSIRMGDVAGLRVAIAASTDVNSQRSRGFYAIDVRGFVHGGRHSSSTAASRAVPIPMLPTPSAAPLSFGALEVWIR